MPARQAPIILRTSERRSAKRCPQQWWWAWRQGLVPIGSISDALWFGIGTHISLAEWYSKKGLKRGRHPAETFTKWAEGELRFIKTSERTGNGAASTTLDKIEPAMELGVAILNGYVEEYGKDDNWDVIQAEQTFQVDVMDPNDIARLLGIYVGTYDLVYRDLRTLLVWLGEHKTARAVRLEHLQMDDQAGGYWLVAAQSLRAKKLIGPKERLEGIMYNFLRKALSDQRPRDEKGLYCNKPTKADYLNALIDVDEWTEEELGKMKLDALEGIAAGNHIEVLGEPSKSQPTPYFVREPVYRTAKERATQLSRIQDEMLVMAAMRDGTIPILKTPTIDCPNMCSFFRMCSLHEQRSNWQELRDASFKVQDPYADHRKSTEE